MDFNPDYKYTKWSVGRKTLFDETDVCPNMMIREMTDLVTV